MAQNIDDPCLPCQQNNYSEEYESIVEEKEEEITPDCVVQFYRSKQEMNGDYGYKDNYIQSNDTTLSEKSSDYYDASFGFDRYNPAVCAEFDIVYYQRIPHLIPKKTVVNNLHLYLCPFLTILPNKKISIYARAEEFFNKNNKNAKVDLIFKSNSKSELAISTDNQKLEIGNKDDICKIEIECKKEFDDTSIEVYQKITTENGEKEVLVGKVIVIGNKVRYKTTIRPVIVRLTKKKNGKTVFLNSDANAVKNIMETYEGLIPYLQNQSFNQAYITCCEDTSFLNKALSFPQAPTSLTSEKSSKDSPYYLEIDIDGIEQRYKDLMKYDAIADAYYLMGSKLNFFKWLNAEYTKQNDAKVKNEAITKTQVEEVMKRFLGELHKGLKKQLDTDHIKNKTITKAFERQSSFFGLFKKKPVIEAYRKYREKREEYLNILEKNGILSNSTGALMSEDYKTGYVHVFFFPDIARADSEDEKTNLSIEDIRGGTYVPAIAHTARGTAYILNVCFSSSTENAYKMRYGYIAHEIGHTLGLRHTFYKRDIIQKYTSKEKKDLDEKKKKKNDLEKLLETSNYERYKNREINENLESINTNTNIGNNKVNTLYSKILNTVKPTNDILFDQIEMEDANSNKTIFENLNDIYNNKKRWEYVGNAETFFDPKSKSINLTWSHNNRSPQGTDRDWRKEFEFLINDIDNEYNRDVDGVDYYLFRWMEIALYMESVGIDLSVNNSTADTATNNSKTQSIIKSETEIRNEITVLEQEIKKLEKYPHLLYENQNLNQFVAQSETEENFMDYRSKKVPMESGINSINDNYIHKSFRFFQWKTMKSTGKYRKYLNDDK